MTGFNRVVLVGNLTRDPALRQIPSGTAVAELGLATNEKYRNREGETVESTCFVDIVTWGKQAQVCGQYLTKGAPVLVEGRLQLDQWKTTDGQNRSKLRVRADRIRFLGKAGHSGESQVDAAAEAANDHETRTTSNNLPF
jgi:single-strand DNA-binding protein